MGEPGYELDSEATFSLSFSLFSPLSPSLPLPLTVCMWYVSTCTWECVHMHEDVFAYACGGQILMLLVFYTFSPFNSLGQSFSLNLELGGLASLMSQSVPVSSSLCLLNAEVPGDLIF